MSKQNIFWMLILLIIGMGVFSAPQAALAQGYAGEDLPPNVSGDDVYRVANQMYCDVCQGVPLSSCPSVTCSAWRQEIANLLGQGFSDEDIYSYFSERYGDDVTGIPLEGEQRNFALLIPTILAVIVGIAITWQVRRMQGENRAFAVARAAGIRDDYDRPVPDNVDPNYLERFLTLLEE